MSLIVSDVKMSSNALVLLGGEPIASFEEQTAGSTIAKQLYSNSYRAILTNHRWRFATKSAELPMLVGETGTRFTYKFALPPDLLYLIRTHNSNEDFEIYGTELHTNHNECTIDYTYEVDETRLPAFVVKAIEFYLAFQFAVPLTGDMDKGNYYRMAYEAELKRAKYADSTQRPGDALDASNRYTAVRY